MIMHKYCWYPSENLRIGNCLRTAQRKCCNEKNIYYKYKTVQKLFCEHILQTEVQQHTTGWVVTWGNGGLPTFLPAHDNSVACKRLHVAGLQVVLKVQRVQVAQDRREQSPLWHSRANDHSVRPAVFQSHILRFACQVGSYSYHRQWWHPSLSCSQWWSSSHPMPLSCCCFATSAPASSCTTSSPLWVGLGLLFAHTGANVVRHL